MSTIRSEMFKTCNNENHENKNTESLGSVFEGLKSLFNEVRSEALDYLFREWPEDPIGTDEHQVYAIDRHILPMKTTARIEIEIEVPDIAANGALRFSFYEIKVMRNITENDKEQNCKFVATIEMFNTKIQTIVTVCLRIMAKHCGEGRNLKLNEFEGDPKKISDYFKGRNGQTSCGHSGMSTECLKIIDMKMRTIVKMSDDMTRSRSPAAPNECKTTNYALMINVKHQEGIAPDCRNLCRIKHIETVSTKKRRAENRSDSEKVFYEEPIDDLFSFWTPDNQKDDAMVPGCAEKYNVFNSDVVKNINALARVIAGLSYGNAVFYDDAVVNGSALDLIGAAWHHYEVAYIDDTVSSSNCAACAIGLTGAVLDIDEITLIRDFASFNDNRDGLAFGLVGSMKHCDDAAFNLIVDVRDLDHTAHTVAQDHDSDAQAEGVLDLGVATVCPDGATLKASTDNDCISPDGDDESAVHDGDETAHDGSSNDRDAPIGDCGVVFTMIKNSYLISSNRALCDNEDAMPRGDGPVHDGAANVRDDSMCFNVQLSKPFELWATMIIHSYLGRSNHTRHDEKLPRDLAAEKTSKNRFFNVFFGVLEHEKLMGCKEVNFESDNEFDSSKYSNIDMTLTLSLMAHLSEWLILTVHARKSQTIRKYPVELIFEGQINDDPTKVTNVSEINIKGIAKNKFSRHSRTCTCCNKMILSESRISVHHSLAGKSKKLIMFLKEIINASNHIHLEETNRKDVVLMTWKNIPKESAEEAFPIPFFSASFQLDHGKELSNKNQANWLRESKDLVTWLAAISCVKINSGSVNSVTGGQNIHRKLFSAEIEKMPSWRFSVIPRAVL